MYEPPLTPGDATAVTARKRGFWFRSIWFSLAGSVLSAAVGIIATFTLLGSAVEQSATVTAEAAGDAVLDAMHFKALGAFIACSVSVIVSVLAAVWFLVSLIRYLTLPKLER